MWHVSVRRMVVKLNRPDIRYEVESLTRMLLGEAPVTVVLPGEIPPRDGDHITVTVSEQPDGCLCRVVTHFDGKTAEGTQSTTPDRTDCEQAVCRLIYDQLTTLLGHTLPWGMLTGVRPVKLVRQMAETGMTAAVQTFLVRKDLYEDMGSPDMSTPEGFLNTLRTLKNEYATYKGVDITPFYAQGGSGYGLTSYLQNFLAVPYEEDGKIYDRISNPDYIEWLKTFRQAYQEGLIGIDYLVDSDDQVTEKSNNGAYFCMLREWSGMQEANAILASSENPDSYYIAIDGPANSNGDAPLIFPGSLDGWMSTFISKDCKDPARAIAFLTYMLSEEGQKDIFLGVEGETYEVVDGKPQLTDEMIELMNSDPNTFATQYGLVDTYWMLRNSVIVDQWRPASPYYITAMSDWADKNAFVNGGIYNNLEPTGDSEEAIAATRINQRWQEVVPELITAASDEEFDKILSDFLAARDSYGYEKVVSYEQNLLDVRKALFQ